MAQRFSPLALPALTVRAELVLQQLADVGEDGAGNHGVHVDRQSASHKLLHRLRTLTRDMHHTALVLHKSDRTIRHQQGERNAIQVVGLQRTAFQSFDPGFGNL